jgi:predicted negative regulator of RcsB-dependent stress response
LSRSGIGRQAQGLCPPLCRRIEQYPEEPARHHRECRGERLATSDPGDAGWQRDLSVSYNKVGDVQVAQGDRAGALKSYRDSLAIAERLATSDPGNAGWQRDLSVSYEKVGDVQVAQGDLAGALKSYRDSLAIAERLATSDPGNAGWQRDLSVSYNRVGDVQVAQGDLAGALKSYRDSLAIAERPIRSRQRRLAARSVGVVCQAREHVQTGWREGKGARCATPGSIHHGAIDEAVSEQLRVEARSHLVRQADRGAGAHGPLGRLACKHGCNRSRRERISALVHEAAGRKLG